ncbi:MAG: VWA domain-containing protein [Bacilli bacterium]|nr:VWA domain-containing protein [Bacilli bacterium]
MDVEFEPISRKVLPVIYVIDTSGSMRGKKIKQVNEAMSQVGELMKDVADNNADADIKIGAMTFSNEPTWITENGLVDCEDFVWPNVEAKLGTGLGRAIEELDKKLSRSEFLKSDTGFAVPIIIFMSDGRPNNGWKKKAEKAHENNWYDMARRIAIAIGDEADREVLAEITGNDELVIGLSDKDIDVLKKLIVAVTVSATKIGTRTHSSEEKDPSVQIVAQTIREIDPDRKQIQSTIDTIDEDW